MSLAAKKCAPCEGGALPLTAEEVAQYRSQIPRWEVSEDQKSISRQFRFEDFAGAMSFANRIADIAEEEGHHPDLSIGWGRVGITLTTHAIGGLSENDFILAAKIDRF